MCVCLWYVSSSPEVLEFPSTMTNIHSGTWIMSGSGVLQNGDTIRENFGRSLDSLRVGRGLIRNLDDFFVLPDIRDGSP